MENVNSQKPKKSELRIAAKVFLWLSFLPYAFIIIRAVFSAFFGFSFFFSTSYGWDAFFSAIFFTGWILVFGFPVLPVCLIYQIIYLSVAITRKVRAKPEKVKWRRIAGRIIFIISLAPNIWLFLGVIVNTISGIKRWHYEGGERIPLPPITGFEAFKYSIQSFFAVSWFISVPAIIFQIIYITLIIRNKIKKSVK